MRTIEPRRAGILLHPTSLSGQHGVGDLGAGTYRFIEWLHAARQSMWQVLPLGPVGLGDSPYAARSAFAGNPVLIALDQLAGAGWLDWGAIEGDEFDDGNVEFERVTRYKLERLRWAHTGFWERASPADREEYGAFDAPWLDDYALFTAIQESRGGEGWTHWPAELALRDPGALKLARVELDFEIDFHRWVQWAFSRQWNAVRAYARQHGIAIMGDIPIFVAHDSADVWAHRDAFLLDERGEPSVVAGVPPDAFSETGQRWGNPLYDWPRLAERDYDWWIERFRATLALVDSVRLDHFRGFEAYWEVPASEETALHGRWVPGPGEALFRAVERALGGLPIVVEDLGLITPEVHALRETLGFPGMKVLQFAFGDDATREPLGDNLYLPHNYQRDCVVYTGTHDNDTTVGWFASLSAEERGSTLRYLGTDGSRIARELARLAYQSVAELAVVPIQDVLELDSKARMNVPGLAEGNWAWRLRPGELRHEHAAWLAELAGACGRATPRS
jgi:4-alpha-glucanotransferase